MGIEINTLALTVSFLQIKATELSVTLTDWKSEDYDNFNFFETDLYSDKGDKENWNNMFAAAQLKEKIESKKVWGDILGCTGNLIINKKVRDIILPFCDPLLILDTLNYQESKFTFFFDESQSDTENIVLDSRKLKDAPDVFRIKHEEYNIIISQNVEDALKKRMFQIILFKNFHKKPDQMT